MEQVLKCCAMGTDLIMINGKEFAVRTFFHIEGTEPKACVELSETIFGKALYKFDSITDFMDWREYTEGAEG